MGTEDKERLTGAGADDAVLVAKARTGDTEAFGELVRRHRGAVFGLAKSIVGDFHLADDVVQEAMVKAFLKLGTLADMRRFLPWLHRIVRNQALRAVRRGGRFAKECPVPEFAPAERGPGARPASTVQAWPAMTPSAVAASREEDPCELLLQHEVTETIAAMIGRLPPAERKVFAAHVFQELSPQEIARLFEASPASVYMSLSRSRKKMQSEALRINLSPSGGKGIIMHSTKSAVLSKPAILHSRIGLYNESIRNCIYHALPYVGKGHFRYDKVMALTGHAFQINIERHHIDLCGVYMYAGTTLYPDGMLNLGLSSSLIDKFGYERMPEGPVKDELFNMTLDMIRESIDRGVPAIFGGVHTQFALYYGYHDERETFYAIDTLGEMEIPYSTFRNRHLYGFLIEEPAAIDEREGFRRALAMAVRHGRGKEATFAGLVNGLQAYDAWIHAFNNKTVDAAGNAACMRNVGDMRGYAASWLLQWKLDWKAKTPSDAVMVSLLSQAAEMYGKVAESFRLLKAMFPYPEGADPGRGDAAHAAVHLLLQAREAEEAGLLLLERMLVLLNDGGPGPRLMEPNPFWVF
ncbi:RNA polymerase sigma factor [Paenibacillus tarimensis]